MNRFLLLLLMTALNRALWAKTRGGFVTCCCALFHRASPNVELANAGHLAPYLHGSEVALDAGMPLGIVADLEYAEKTIEVEGGCLTFVSDGVVEAANAKGELFGFDRTREMSTRTAQQIADAAKAWGQNDDITVVTVTRGEVGS